MTAGRPIEYAERIQDGVRQRRCRRCGEWLPKTPEYFYAAHGSLLSACKDCEKKRRAAYRDEIRRIKDGKPLHVKPRRVSDAAVAQAIDAARKKFAHWDVVRPSGHAPSEPGW